MRQSVMKFSVLLAVAAAACSEPTGVNSQLKPVASPAKVTTSTGGQLNIISGNSQIVAPGTFTTSDPSVQVVDSNGAAVAGVTVTFTRVAVTGVATSSTVGYGGTCSSTLPGTTATTTTNASGIAVVRWCFNARGGQSMTATALGTSVTFNGIATTGGAAPTMAFNNAANFAGNNAGTMGGQVTVGNPTVTVSDGTGFLPGVLVNFSANGDGTVSSTPVRGDANGEAAVVWTARTTSTANTLTASITGFTSAGVPANNATLSFTAKPVGTVMNAVAGTTDSTTTTTTFPNNKFGPKDPAVQILKADGTVVGAGVAVTVTYGTGSGDCGVGSNAGNIAYTDANGVVAAPWCNTLAATGTRTIKFTAGTLTQTITGSVKNNLTSATLTIDSGTGATGTVGQVATPDVAVTVKDANGAVIANAAVTFTASAGGTVANGTQSSNTITVNTNSSGQAAARWTFGTTAGAQTVTATVSVGGGATATITGTASAAAAASISKVAGDNQTATKGTAVPKNPSVIVRDQYGNTVDGVQTVWIPSGNGSVSQSVIATGNAGQGSVPGVAANVWTLSTTAGANTLTVTISGTSLSVTFSATGT